MFRLRNLPPDCWLDGGGDGIGTEPILLISGGFHRNAASHLIAMTFGDMTRHGRLPLMLLANQFDATSVGMTGSDVRIMCQEIFYGLKELADRHHFIVYKGETAQMGRTIGLGPDTGFTFNWSGTVLAAAHPDKEITGHTLRPGHVLVAFREYGFRACGISSVRKAFVRHFGREYWKLPEAKKAIRSATAPAVLYDQFLCEMNGWFASDFQPLVPMHAIAHLSGGSFESKLGKDVLFPRGLSADLSDLFDPPEIMFESALWRGMSDEEAYAVWNGGQGMLVAVDDVDADYLIAQAASRGIEARICGGITKRRCPSVAIASKFRGESVEFFADGR